MPEMIQDVYPKIEFSYKFLESEEAKSCFFLCCLYPEGGNIEVEDLVKHGFGLGIFKEIELVVQGRNCVEALVYRLKSYFLLLDSNKQGCVKMHEVVHNVALFLTSQHNF